MFLEWYFLTSEIKYPIKASKTGINIKLAFNKKYGFMFIAVKCEAIPFIECLLNYYSDPYNISAFSYPDAEYWIMFMEDKIDVEEDFDIMRTK